MAVAQTYRIHLCNNGKKVKVLPNVLDDGHPRPSAVGTVIDEKWRVRGVISHGISDLVVDVDEIAAAGSA
jgi:hypothetical protein